MTAPVLDGRVAAELLDELVERVPGYSAQWRPQAGGSGYALLQILARYCELVVTALDGAVDKGMLAFLDALGVDLLPPQAARVPLVFEIAPDSPLDPPLPAGTQVAASAPPRLASSLAAPPRPQPAVTPDMLTFATDEQIALTRARLAAVYSSDPDSDEYADHSAQVTSGFTLFDGLGPVTHHLYLGHDSLLALTGDVDLSLDFDLESGLVPGGTTKSGKPKLPKGLDLSWEYLAKDGWVEFDPVRDKSFGLSLEGEVQLQKRCGPDADKAEVNGVSSYWLRARMNTPLPYFGPEDEVGLPLVASVKARLAVDHDGLPPDVALADDVRLDTTRDFLPFGTQPAIGSSLLVACDDAFKREGARIGIDVDFTPGANIQPSSDLALFWEYSAAPGVWKALGGTDSEFADHTQGLSAPTTIDPAVSFIRPPDWAKVPVNGEQHFWLRIRIDTGGFGGPPTFSVEDDGSGGFKVVAHDEPHPPSLRGLRFSYAYRTPPFVPDHCLALNGFEYADHSDANRWGRESFAPFAPLPDRYPAVYLGFDRALPVGLVSLYVDVPGSGGSAYQTSPYVWEYGSADGWSELAVLDETAGFARSGLIQLIGAPDAAPGPGPGGDRYWIRARTKEATLPDPAPVGALYVNAVWATQRNAVEGEVLGRSDGTARQAMLAQHAPILARQLLEVQEWHGRGREWESLFADVPAARVRYDRDPRGTVTGVWVTWEERPYLYSSAPGDRHYVVERSTGLVRFGNGVQGLVPMPGSPVMLSYDYGGGVAGNLPAAAVTDLHSAVPFVTRVANPIVAAGGAAGETVAGVRRRGPERLRSAGRSLSAEDYEWLAREASPEVAVARCLPVTGPDGGGEPGWVTVLIIPQGEVPEPQPSQQLLQTVERALRAEAPAAIASQVLVAGPTYQPIAAIVEAIPADPGAAAETEEAIARALDAFLHPVTGGPAAQGWDFGAAIELSQVVRAILAVPGVMSAPHVALVSDSDVYGDAVPVARDALPSAGKHLIKLEVGVA